MIGCKGLIDVAVVGSDIFHAEFAELITLAHATRSEKRAEHARYNFKTCPSYGESFLGIVSRMSTLYILFHDSIEMLANLTF